MILVRPPSAYCLCVVLAMAAVQPASLEAQTRKFEGMVVRNIQFVPENQALEASELHDLLPLKMNVALSMADVRASIEKLFATGTYTDIQVEAQPYRDGVAIVFHTTAAWFIGSVSVEGKVSSPPSIGQLENAATLSLGQPYREAALQQSIAGQQRAFRNNGLFQADIHPEFDWETG